jgi:hypothetical protein
LNPRRRRATAPSRHVSRPDAAVDVAAWDRWGSVRVIVIRPLALRLFATATAQAAQPFTIAPDGANPNVADAPDGTAHVVWDRDIGVTSFTTH